MGRISGMMRATGIFVCLVLLIPAPAIAQSLPPASAFASAPTYRSPEFSPNGRFVSVIRREGEDYFIGVADLLGQVPTKFIPAGKDRIFRWTRWANDDRLLAGISKIVDRREEEVVTDGTNRTVAFDRDGSNPIILFADNNIVLQNNEKLAMVAHILPSDREHVIMPAFYRDMHSLYKVDVYSGEAKLIVKGQLRTIGWMLDHKGKPIIRIDVSAYWSKIKFFSRNDGSRSWKMFKEVNLRELDLVDFWPFAAGPKEGTLFVLARPDGADKRAIYLYDLVTNEYVEKVVSHEKVDIRGALMDPRDGKFLGATFFVDRYGIESLDANFQSMFDALDASFSHKASVRISDINMKHTRAILDVSGPGIPGDYYVFDFSTRALSRLYSQRPEINPEQLGTMDVKRITMSDGEVITAYVTHPPGRETEKAPLIVLPHSGPWNRDYYVFDLLPQFLASRGYRVLQPNFRGSVGYGLEFEEMGYGEWGGRMQDDVLDSVMYLVGEGLAETKNICIAGVGYGGFSALSGAQTNSDIYSCAVSISGPTDLIHLLREQRGLWGGLSETYEDWVESVGDPISDRGKLARLSPALNAKDIDIPILLAHRRYSFLFSVEHSREMRSALKRAGKSVDYIELDKDRRFEIRSRERLVSGETLAGLNDEDELILYNKLEEFFGEHLTGQ